MNVNCASKFELLRVPGLGPVTVKWILERRRRNRMRYIEDVGKVGVRLKKASKYLSF